MNALFRSNPIEVGNRLEELGLKKEWLVEVTNAMVLARNNCTENDPPAAPGWSAWRDGTRRLREVLIPHGWAKDDQDMLSSAYNEKSGIKIFVSNTNNGTGLVSDQPQNNSEKGAATERVIAANNEQFEFSSILDQVPEIPNVVTLPRRADLVAKNVTHWYLCVFSDGDTVRAELSCPIQCVGGFFTEFSERIIILDGENNGSAPVQRTTPIIPEDETGFEIPITRKAAS